MIKTWAALTNGTNVVFAIVEFSIMDPAPYENTEYIGVPTEAYAIPEIGDIWTGDGFIKP
jgi:hypothetical protein